MTSKRVRNKEMVGFMEVVLDPDILAYDCASIKLDYLDVQELE